MSKGNLFLGFGRGKVGDVVFSRQNGEQVTRARNRAPRNPQSPLQLLQRSVMKTSSLAYSLMQDICNHSFQGFAEGTACQSRFLQLNVEKFRNQLADEINSGEAEDIMYSTKCNFAGRSTSLPEVNEYIVSEGTLPAVAIGSDTINYLTIDFGAADLAAVKAMTYQQVVDYLGLLQGDQLTILAAAIDDTPLSEAPAKFVAFAYARIILEPANGDMSTTFFDADGAINSPNVKNQGNVTMQAGASSLGAGATFGLQIQFSGMMVRQGDAKTLSHAACIVSRLAGGVWSRSKATLKAILTPSYDTDQDTLGDAVQSYLVGANSSLYLNQSV